MPACRFILIRRSIATALAALALGCPVAGWIPSGAAARSYAGHRAHHHKGRVPRRAHGHVRRAGAPATRSSGTPPSGSSGTSSTPATGASPAPESGALIGDDTKTPCLYASHHISLMDAFGAAVGRAFQCAMVFNDAAPDWSSWEHPWFINNTYPDMSWKAWATAPGTDRELVITQNLFPASEDSADWLTLGASGAFEPYARALAANLVAAGLGTSVIRLAHEANGTWYPDSIPGTPQGDAEWVQFWRNTVFAMRSVPGAHFLFDWTVNANYRNVPLSSFYPGDDAVDIVGIDAYDSAVPASVADRWGTIYGRPDGIQAVAAFAALHHKPLSIPEWGLGPAIEPGKGQGGDDPAYVNGIASVVASDDVAYQSYFDSGEQLMQFFNSPGSIAAYAQHFGAEGDAVSGALRDPQAAPPSPAPWLEITGGPADGSTIQDPTATFTFSAQPGYTATCSLDGQAWRPCSTAGSDILQGLSAGYHRWNVQVSDARDEVTLLGRAFLVAPPASAGVRGYARPAQHAGRHGRGARHRRNLRARRSRHAGRRNERARRSADQRI